MTPKQEAKHGEINSRRHEPVDFCTNGRTHIAGIVSIHNAGSLCNQDCVGTFHENHRMNGERLRQGWKLDPRDRCALLAGQQIDSGSSRVQGCPPVAVNGDKSFGLALLFTADSISQRRNRRTILECLYRLFPFNRHP